MRSIELRLRGARHRWPWERHHEPGQQRVPTPIPNQVLLGVEQLAVLGLLVQRGQPEHLEVRAVAAESRGEREHAGGGASHELGGERAGRAGEARAAERAAAGGERGGIGAGWIGGEGEPEAEVGEEHAAEAAGGGAGGGGRDAEELRERRVGQTRREAGQREREEHGGREGGGVGEERLEEAREEVEGGRRDPERERVVVQARGRQRQGRRRWRWRLLLRGRVRVGVGVGRFGVRGGAGLVAAQALARAGGGAEEDEERGGRVSCEEEGERGRHGGERRGRMVLLLVVREWLSRRCGEIREDFVGDRVMRRHPSMPLPCKVAFHFFFTFCCRAPTWRSTVPALGLEEST